MAGVVGKNIFSALQKKKSKSKVKADESSAAQDEANVDKHAEIEKALFSGPSTGVSNWADELEDDWAVEAAPGLAEDGWNQVQSVPQIIKRPRDFF